MVGADLDAPRSETVPSAFEQLPMTAVLPGRPDLPGTSPGQTAKDMPPSGSSPRNGAGTARANIDM